MADEATAGKTEEAAAENAASEPGQTGGEDKGKQKGKKGDKAEKPKKEKDEEKSDKKQKRKSRSSRMISVRSLPMGADAAQRQSLLAKRASSYARPSMRKFRLLSRKTFMDDDEYEWVWELAEEVELEEQAEVELKLEEDTKGKKKGKDKKGKAEKDGKKVTMNVGDNDDEGGKPEKVEDGSAEVPKAKKAKPKKEKVKDPAVVAAMNSYLNLVKIYKERKALSEQLELDKLIAEGKPLPKKEKKKKVINYNCC